MSRRTDRRLLMRALVASSGSVRRIAVLVFGSVVLAFGVMLIVLPGPAFIVIPAGLAILGIEFAWARRWMRIAKARTAEAYKRTAFSREPGRSY